MRSFFRLATLLVSSALVLAPAWAQELSPRKELPAQDLRQALASIESLSAAQPPSWRVDLVIKFEDAVLARAEADGSLSSRSGFDLSAARDLASQVGGRFRPLIRMDESELRALEQRAAQRSATAQPDLAGMLVLELSSGGPRELANLGERLQALPSVEFASLHVQGIAPPGDILPPTPDHTPLQTYRVDPPGLDAAYIISIGATGGGVRLSDCEYGWNPAHEDLVDIDTHPEPGQTIPPFVYSNGWDEHGTAVLGETSAVVNAYGCTGLVPDAEVYTYPEWSVEEGARRVTCITHAIASSSVGDVVLLEMQTGAGAPAEVDPAVWTVVKTGTDAGVVVVGAAGNGDENLDSPAYASYAALGDSGAILVGAGTANSTHAKLFFSSYGTRVNVQGWGEAVFSLGYGSFAAYGGDKNQRYLSDFSGTSSASPFVASACVAIQDMAKSSLGFPLSSIELRTLLVATGISQGGPGGHIGPFPDVEAAIGSLGCPTVTSFCTGMPNSVGGGASLSHAGSTSIASNDLVLSASAMPPGNSALFFYGAGQSIVPFGNGVLCASGGTVFRLLPSVTIGPSGDASHALDLTQPPASSGPGEITPSSEWTFQCWYRDPAAGGAAFNTSNALRAVFCL